MITKRIAIRAIFMGVLAKMAHADEPPKSPSATTTIPLDPATGTWGNSSVMTITDWNKPLTWTVNLDMMAALHVLRGGEEVVITADELFSALKP